MPNSELSAKQSRIVFSCGRDYTVRDLIDAAYVRGEVKPIWTELLESIACEKHAVEQELESDEAAIASAAEAFRYERDLITAEETEQWLEMRGLTLSDFSDYFNRCYWWNHLREEVKAKPVDYVAASQELRQLLAGDLIFSGELDRMATRQSWRDAGMHADDNKDPETPSVAAERERFLEREGIGAEGLLVWLHGLERDSLWFAEMLAMEATYRRRCTMLLDARARERELSALRLPLTRFEIETMEVDSHDAAGEALFCVRDDGMSMAEVAEEASYPYRRSELVLENIAEDLQQKFLSVSPGAILDPIPRGDGFQLCRVLSKSEPSLEDPVVRERVDKCILERHFSELAAKYIEWAQATSTT